MPCTTKNAANAISHDVDGSSCAIAVDDRGRLRRFQQRAPRTTTVNPSLRRVLRRRRVTRRLLERDPGSATMRLFWSASSPTDQMMMAPSDAEDRGLAQVAALEQVVDELEQRR